MFVMVIIAILVLIFMIVPIIMLYPVSLSSTSYIVFPNEDYSTQWFERILSDPEWILAIENSLKIAIITTVVSLVLGVMVAVCMNRLPRKYKNPLDEYFRLPQTIPIIVTAISVYALLLKMHLNGSVLGMVIAHTVIALPFVVSQINAGLTNTSINFEDAAVNLGSNRIRAFFDITLPMIKGAIGSAVLFAFLTSFDEIAVTMFVTGPSVITIPKKMWDGIRLQIEPTIAAISVIEVTILIVGFMLITLGQIISKKKISKGE